MTDRIKEHIDFLLKDAPRTRRVVDLREELLSGCLDKYADLTASGMSQEEAYKAVISGIGDINELIGAARRPTNDLRMLGPLSSSLWSLIVLVYLFLGFMLGYWHPGWLIFPVGAFLQQLLDAAFAKSGRRKGHITGAIYTGAVVVFLTLGLYTGMWVAACLIFAFAVSVQQIARLVQVWRDDR